jgi:hypothetical protein
LVGGDGAVVCFSVPEAICLVYTDTDGNAAGGAFDSVEDAVKDFAMIYNDDSIRNKAEYASVIYQYHDSESGKNQYTYLEPVRGDNSSALVVVVGTSDVYTPAAIVHTHGGFTREENTVEKQIGRLLPSPDDKNAASRHNIPVYTCTPAGFVTMLEPKRDRASLVESITGIPMDPNNKIDNRGLSTNKVNMWNFFQNDPYFDSKTGKIVK